MNSEKFENHALFNKLQSLDNLLSDEGAKDKIQLEELSFIQTVSDYIRQRVQLTIPDLIQDTEMDGLSNEIHAGVSQLNTFMGNGNIGHLTNGKNNLYSALNRVKGFPIPVSKADFNFSKKIASFENTVKKKYQSIEKENEQLRKEISAFKTDLDNKQKEIASLLKLVEGKELEIQNLTSSFQTEFNNIRSEHSQDFQNDKRTFRTEIDQSKESFRKEIDDLKAGVDTSTSELVKKLEEKLSEAQRIVNVIGNIGVTGNFQKVADGHKKSANFWRWAAIIFMSAFSGFLIWTIIDLSSDGYNWTKSLIRVIAAAALSYPATYAARESSKHRKLENLNRTAELELASVDAFIEILDPQKKQGIKEKLVDKYFGNDKAGVLESDKENEGLSIGGFERLLNAFSKTLGK